MMCGTRTTIKPRADRRRLAGALLLALTAAGLPGCDQNDPTGTELPASSPVQAASASGGTGGVTESADATRATAQLVNAGTFTYPVNDTINLPDESNFNLVQLGLGGIANFSIKNPNSAEHAIEASTFGTGRAVQGSAYGKGIAAYFTSSAAEAVYANSSNNFAFHGVSGGMGGAALFENTYYNTTKPALWARTSQGWGNAAFFEKTSTTNPYPTLAVKNAGGGYAGAFVTSSTNGKGVYIETKGGAGLQVVGGSKNAVVRTPSGAKALYSEESSEVWFTDYGFGKLDHGRARILFDPSFAQTVNPDEPYHVFIQSYGDAELYVQGRTPVGFDIVLRAGDANAEFSYRIVAKRLGFEDKRMEPAPWVDQMDAEGRQVP